MVCILDATIAYEKANSLLKPELLNVWLLVPPSGKRVHWWCSQSHWISVVDLQVVMSSAQNDIWLIILFQSILIFLLNLPGVFIAVNLKYILWVLESHPAEPGPSSWSMTRVYTALHWLVTRKINDELWSLEKGDASRTEFEFIEFLPGFK